jgi:hypothetical protein
MHDVRLRIIHAILSYSFSINLIATIAVKMSNGRPTYPHLEIGADLGRKDSEFDTKLAFYRHYKVILQAFRLLKLVPS